MGVMGFRRSTAWKMVFPPDGCYPSYFDHARVWLLGKRYVVTADPYSPAYEDTLAWCAANKWECFVMPSGFSLWNPPGPHGTRLVVASPPTRSASIADLEPTFLERLPRWE
jgi:hypothetical protein